MLWFSMTGSPFCGSDSRFSRQLFNPRLKSGPVTPFCLGNDPFSYRIEDDVRGAVKAKLLHEFGTMTFNSLRAEIQQAGNILVRLAFSEQLQDFFFSIGKQVIRIVDMLMLKLPHIVRQQHFANRGTKKMAVLSDRLQGEG